MVKGVPLPPTAVPHRTCELVDPTKNRSGRVSSDISWSLGIRRPWSQREFHIEDRNGYCFRFCPSATACSIRADFDHAP